MSENKLDFIKLLKEKDIPYTVLNINIGIIQVEGFIIKAEYTKTFTLSCFQNTFFKVVYNYAKKYWDLYITVDKIKWYHIPGIKHNVEKDGPDFIFQEPGIIIYRNWLDEIVELYIERYEDGIKTISSVSEPDIISAFIEHQNISKASEPSFFETDLEVMDSFIFHTGIDDTFSILNASLDDTIVELSDGSLIIPPIGKHHREIRQMYPVHETNNYLIFLK